MLPFPKRSVCLYRGSAVLVVVWRMAGLVAEEIPSCGKICIYYGIGVWHALPDLLHFKCSMMASGTD